MKKTLVIGHRGTAHLGPQNTLSFAKPTAIAVSSAEVLKP